MRPLPSIDAKKLLVLKKVLSSLAKDHHWEITNPEYRVIEEAFENACFNYAIPALPARNAQDIRTNLTSLHKTASKLCAQIDKLALEETIWVSIRPGYEQLLEKIRGDASELISVTEILVRPASTKGKGKINNTKKEFIETLIDIYEQVTGDKARRSYDSLKQKHTGPLFRFIQICIALLSPDLKDSVIGESIRTILASRRH